MHPHVDYQDDPHTNVRNEPSDWETGRYKKLEGGTTALRGVWAVTKSVEPGNRDRAQGYLRKQSEARFDRTTRGKTEPRRERFPAGLYSDPKERGVLGKKKGHWGDELVSILSHSGTHRGACLPVTTPSPPLPGNSARKMEERTNNLMSA